MTARIFPFVPKPTRPADPEQLSEVESMACDIAKALKNTFSPDQIERIKQELEGGPDV